MSIFWNAARCLSEYIDLRDRGALGEPERPRECEACGEVDCYWAHGSYSRKVEEGEIRAEIAVPRWKCRWCAATLSVLPCFVVPWCRYTMRVIAAGVTSYATKPTTYRDEVMKLGETGPSPVQLFRWVAFFVEGVNGLLLDVQRMCIAAGMEAEELLEFEELVCPNAWKAVIEGKDEKLNTAGKVVAFAQALFKDSVDWVLEHLGMEMLRREARRIFAGQTCMISTPQRRKPRNSKVF